MSRQFAVSIGSKVEESYHEADEGLEDSKQIELHNLSPHKAGSFNSTSIRTGNC